MNRIEEVADLKYKIFILENIQPDQQRIIYAGQQLENRRTLIDYNIWNDSIVYLILRLRGDGDHERMFSYLNNITGERVKLPKCINTKSTIGTFKEAIGNSLALNNKLFKIYINDLELEHSESMTLQACGIGFGDVIRIWYPTYLDIIKHQNVEGYWNVDVLCEFNKTLEDTTSKIPEILSTRLKNIDDQLRVICTVLALKFLKSMYPQDESEWRLISIKGKNYIKTQGFKFAQLSLAL